MKKPYGDYSTRRAMLLIAFGVLLFVLAGNLSAVGRFLRWGLSLISPLILGLAIAFVLNVLMRGFEEKVFAAMGRSAKPAVRRWRRPLSLICTFLSIFVVIALILLVIIPGIEETVTGLAVQLPAFGKRCLEWITALMVQYNISADLIAEMQVDWNNFFNVIYDALVNGTGSLFDFATGLTTSLFGGLIDFFVGLVLAIYVVLQKEKIAAFIDRALSAFLSERVTNKIEEIARLSNQTFANFITGQLLEAVILGVLCFIGMLIFGFPYAGVVSVLVAVSALIPIFGAWIGGGISAFLILMESPIKALLFLVFLIVLQQLENNLIYPRVVGKQVGLPAILVILAVMVGSEIGGIAAILVSVPVCSVCYTLFRQLVDYRLSRKQGKGQKENVPEEEPSEATTAVQTAVSADSPAQSPVSAEKPPRKKKKGKSS
ncbi:MAG: AI-2E family transporter [Ruminococcaceae bacterium]|nr:AI-2E family transporter [Oscillospiraceae bacterium]